MSCQTSAHLVHICSTSAAALLDERASSYRGRVASMVEQQVVLQASAHPLGIESHCAKRACCLWGLAS